MSIIDTRVDRMLRSRHMQRLNALADAQDDKAYEVASTTGFQRGRHSQYWAERTRSLALAVAMEPTRRVTAPVVEAVRA